MKGIPTLYHNPKCSKSRQALDLLRKRGIEPEVVEYLKKPPDASTLRELIRKLGVEAHAVLRTKEDAYREAKLSPSSTVVEIIQAITRHPILLERPILVAGASAVIGRPPDRVLELV